MNPLKKFFLLLPVTLHRIATALRGNCSIKTSRPMFANIGEGTQEHGIKTYIADAATSYRYLCYKRGTDADHSAITGSGDLPLGASDDQAEAGLPIAINMFGVKPGLIRVVTDGTISDGDRVKCGATGYVTKASTTDLSFGIACIGTDASSAAGDTIVIQHCVPHKYVF
jgi:hypothetical protein